MRNVEAIVSRRISLLRDRVASNQDWSMSSTSLRFVRALLVAATCVAPRLTHAQAPTSSAVATTAIFAGTVMVDPTETPIANAEVVFTALNRSTRSDSAGNFSIAGLPAGKHTVTVRLPGYDTFTTDVMLGASERVSADMMLRPNAPVSTAQALAASILSGASTTTTSPTTAQLDAFAVSGKAPTRTSERMSGFEDRRKSGAGRFITSEEIAKDEGRTLSAIIVKRISGARIQQVNGRKYLVSGRQGELRLNGSVMKGGSMPGTEASSLDLPRGCYVQVIVDGIMRYNGTPGQPLFDLDQLEPKDIIGFEMHTSATIPAQYNATQSPEAGSCGMAIIWTKAG